MSPRAWIVVAQTAAVGALVVVVYVTILRPEDGGEITRIKTPNEGPAITRVHPGARPGERREAGQAAGRRFKRRHPAPEAGAGAGAVTALLTGGLVPAPATAGPEPDKPATGPPARTPSGDQYTDTAKALLEQLGAGTSPGN